MAKDESFKEEMFACLKDMCTQELKTISSTKSPSILRKTSKKDLVELTFNNVREEFCEKIPTIFKLVTHLTKGKENVYNSVHICNMLVSSYNEHLSALRFQNGLFMRSCRDSMHL